MDSIQDIETGMLIIKLSLVPNAKRAFTTNLA
jgi:hypothetical protein